MLLLTKQRNKLFPILVEMHDPIKNINSEELFKCQKSFIILNEDSILQVLRIFIKSRKNKKTTSKN